MFYAYYGYYWILIPAILLTLYAQAKVSGTFNKYSRTRSASGITGAQAAELMLHNAGIYDVRVERIGGNLTDHYDPSSKVLRLSESVYASNSLSAVGVAAHETGHAIQHATGYAPLFLRTSLVPLTNISSRLSMPLIVLGIVMSSGSRYSFGGTLVLFGIMLFSLAVLFSLVTLPVEFNASSRAVKLLGEYGILSNEEIRPVKQVLSAAAMTYVAAAASSIASLLRLLLIYNSMGGRRRR